MSVSAYFLCENSAFNVNWEKIVITRPGCPGIKFINGNQYDSVDGTVQTVPLRCGAGWIFNISHRSGNTENSHMEAFAVTMEGGRPQPGFVSRGGRQENASVCWNATENWDDLPISALSPFPQ